MSDNTLKAFREVSTEMDNVYAAFIKASGLSESEYWSLLLIHDGVDTQSRISEQLCYSRQTLNSAFRQLVKKNLITLELREDNQRTKWAVLTPKGKAFVEEQLSVMDEVEGQAWQKLTEEEQQTLVRLVRTYTSHLRETLKILK